MARRRRRHALFALLLCTLVATATGAAYRTPSLAPTLTLPRPLAYRHRRDLTAYLASRATASSFDEDYSSEAPFDPFEALDYDSSEEPEPVPKSKPKSTPRPRPDGSPRPQQKKSHQTKIPTWQKPAATPRPKAKATPRPGAKVTVSAKVPKVTVKTKNGANRRNVIKTTTVDIENFTRFVVTEPSKPPQRKPHRTTTSVRPPKPKSTTKRPKAPPARSKIADDDDVRAPERRKDSTQRPRPATPRPPAKKPPKRTPTTERNPTRNQTTKKPPAKKSPRPPGSSTRKPRPKPSSPPPPRRTRTPPTPTTQHLPYEPYQPYQPYLPQQQHNFVPQRKTDQCPPKDTGWIASFFDAHHRISNHQNTNQPGILNKVYSWFGWEDSREEPSTTTWVPSWQTLSTTTTPPPPPTTTTESNWFYSLLNAEEDDGAYAATTVNNTDKNKKSIRKKYNGFQLLRTFPEVAWKVHELLDLQEETQGSGIMWWTTPSVNTSTDILIPPDLLADMKDHLNSLGLEYDVVIWDLQKAIMYENPKLSKKQRVELEQVRGHPLTWRRYHRYADILRYLEYLQLSHPDLVDLVPLGRSSEGLPLVAVKVSFPSNDSNAEGSYRATSGVRVGSKPDGQKRWRLRSKMKPAVWLEAGGHAREWIAPAVATWILHSLVEGDRGQGADYEMLKAADWYITPLLNPDGYEHSHTHDRLWRKTRSKHTREDTYYNSWFPWNWGNTDCVGVDADRNYDFHWGEKGASKDPCSENYSGPHPFSEPETRAASQFLMENKERIKVYVSLHAYSQMWLVPSTHSRVPFPDDGEVMEMGKLATAALADMFGTKYQVGTTADLSQPTTGAAFEWAKGHAGIKYSYSIKLRDSHGPYGFLLPGSQIVPTAKETWIAVKTIVENL